MFERLTGTATFNLLGKGLEVSSKRHKVISNNIANVNTPLFKRQIVTFEDQMAKVFDGKVDIVGRREDDRHIPIGTINYMDVDPVTIKDRIHVMRNDKNNVDIDVEMSDLAKNTMTYQIHSSRLAAMFAGLNDVITRGGRA
ncbi:MAG TPA: flagellar basal body rod protein FlgB [Candidatus Rifleibacterium sp.]|jgi:flagellar basal-body rod protein FlgB|nr:flagellar basal body rod protein FlgB [Candidatus Rifleibacterium sp.]HNS09299.1 flagellar basal body rod protein FlgB [Candidatus Ozemobacteraceae bacterium]HNW12130.1 flagellar basal body rod protein FlgB [Candidatus Rifleibacterium sp.]HOI90653.1 flagellar basal body rod protein FlgB [Candidatus Rifleibacterium sp.]HQB83498.1 flagellar basal body rod protein FlgB [Candidatus Rifleibacterium sp.]